MSRLLFLPGLCALIAPAPAQTPLQQLTATGGVACEQFGHGLAMYGERIVAGAAAASEDPTLPCALGPGAVYVFDRQGGAWVQTQRLAPPDGQEGDEFGNSVAVWQDLIVVGSELHDTATGQDAGAAYVFELQAGTWVQVAKLEPSDAAPLQSFARSVAVQNQWILVGARLDSALGMFQAGAVYVFRRNAGGTWDEVQKLYASDPIHGALFGSSVSIDGDTFVVGAQYALNQEGIREGAAYAFQRDGLMWKETQRLGPWPSYVLAQFGRSVSIHGDQILVGSRNDGGTGAAYVFDRGPHGTWVQGARLTPSVGADGDEYGESVAIRGHDAIVGARLCAPVSAVEGRAFLYQRQDSGWVETAVLSPKVPDTTNLLGYNVALSAHGAAAGAPFDLDALGSVYVVSVPSGVNYCTAGTSASGCQALISADGVASASQPSGFDLRADSVEGAKDGLFFLGTSGRQANPWGSSTSFQCIVPPVIRGGLIAATGTVGLCDGVLSQDLNALWCGVCPKPLKNPGPGAMVQAQLWYRDPLNTSNQTTSLSNAIEFLVEP